MGNLDDRIAVATRHVTEGRRIVEKQKQLVAQRRAGPHGVELLATFEKSQEIFEFDLERLLGDRGSNRNHRNEALITGVVGQNQQGETYDESQERQAD
jgi:hypothetical protein